MKENIRKNIFKLIVTGKLLLKETVHLGQRKSSLVCFVTH